MTTNFELTSAIAYQPSTSQLTASPYNTRSITTSTAQASSAAIQDTASLSSTTLLANPVSNDDSRSAHIAALSQSIAAGTYSIPAFAVASSIIDSIF